MTPQHEEFASIESDDALLDAVAARGYADDDPAGALLADIVGAVDRIAPSMGARRRGRRHRGGIWGISLGVSIVVAAGGGLSAAAAGRLPEPVQHVVGDLGQIEPPALAEQPTPTVSEDPPADAPTGDTGWSGGGSHSTGAAPGRVDSGRRVPWQLVDPGVPAQPWSRPTGGGGDGPLVPPQDPTWAAQLAPQSKHDAVPPASGGPTASSPGPARTGYPTDGRAPASPYPHPSDPAATRSPSPAPGSGDGSPAPGDGSSSPAPGGGSSLPAPGRYGVPSRHLVPSLYLPPSLQLAPTVQLMPDVNPSTPQASADPAPRHPVAHPSPEWNTSGR